MNGRPASAETLVDPMPETTPAEVWFYHLQQQPLERVLPVLLERTLERGWRAVVQVGSQERLEALDTHLWTYAEESFLPHGTAREGAPERQPILLTTGEERPNGATLRFLVDGARPGDLGGLSRVVFLFDGGDPAAVEQARGHWKAMQAAGYAVTYWQQDAAGKWVKKA